MSRAVCNALLLSGLAQAQISTVTLMAGFAAFVNALPVSGSTLAKSMNEYVAWVRSRGTGKGMVGVPALASVPEFLVKLIGQKYAQTWAGIIKASGFQAQ